MSGEDQLMRNFGYNVILFPHMGAKVLAQRDYSPFPQYKDMICNVGINQKYTHQLCRILVILTDAISEESEDECLEVKEHIFLESLKILALVGHDSDFFSGTI